MKLSIDFYFQEAKTSEHCTDTPSGTLHVDNFLQGKSYWIQPVLPRELKQKKLILSDWTARFWSEDKKIAMSDLFTQLLDQGFSLYCYISGKLEPISKKSLPALLKTGALTLITPTNSEDIYRVATTQNISRDQLLLLDDYLVECLHQDRFDIERTLYESHYTNNSPRHQKTILQNIKKSKPPLSKIIFDESLTEKTYFSQDVKDFYPHVKTHYQHLIITTELWSWLESQSDLSTTSSQNHPPGFKLFDDQLTIAELLMIQSITVDPLCTNFNLHKTLMLMPNLKKINLSECKHIKALFRDLHEQHLDKIEEINLFGTDPTAADITALLKATPNLKKIELNYCENIATCLITLNKNSLEKLEEINLYCTDLIAEDITALLKIAPNLKKIYLSECNHIKALVRDLHEQHLDKLEEINLFGTDPTAANITALLKATPNLKKIDLTYCANISKCLITFNKNSLEKLEEVNLTGTNLTAADITALLKAAPNLKTINLSECNPIKELFKNLHEQHLEELEEINLTETDLTAADITALLQAAPNLKKINLSKCKNIKGFFKDPHEQLLEKLEEINLTETDLTAADITALLKAAPNLKKINLSKCAPIKELFKNIHEQHFEELEEINLSCTDITAADVTALLKAAPNLKTINLSECNPIKELFKNLHEQHLEELEEINLSYTDITAADVTALLKAAPNLKTIDLLNCSIKGAFENLMPESLKRLTNISYPKSHFTKNDILYILNKIPSLNTTYAEELRQYLKSKVTEPSPHGLDEKIHSPQPHNPQDMKNFKPSPENKPFKYTGTKNIRNQKMVIEKFSQYLITLKKRPELAAKIQDGMCHALSYFFQELTVNNPDLKQWHEFTTHLRQWNGDPNAISDELKLFFDHLLVMVIEHQLNQSGSQYHFIGENLTVLTFNQQPSFILTNPWHSVCVQKEGETYQYYDPNNAEVMIFHSLDDLHKQVVFSIGKLILVCHLKNEIPTPALRESQSINQFIAHGGLFILTKCNNAMKLAQQIPVDFQFEAHALEGLLLRSTKAIPAWMLGLQSRHKEIQTLTINLLTQFHRLCSDAQAQLKQSAADVPAYQKHDTAANVIPICLSNDSANTPLREFLLDMLRQQQAVYKQSLNTWNPKQSAPVSIHHYCQQHVSPVNCFGEKTQNQLIECQSTAQLHHFTAVLHDYCKHTSRPVFYIDSPDDLTCSASFIQTNPTNPNQGHLQTGPGGPLHDFLTKHQHTQAGPVLIVNYERFKPDDIVRFNSLIDAKPQADGTDLPTDTVLIGLTNTASSDYYNGADFKSRFDVFDQCPFRSEELEQSVDLPPIIESPSPDQKHIEDNSRHPEGREGTPHAREISSDIRHDIRLRDSMETSKNTVINLYHAPDWKSRLLGHWVIHGQSLTYQAGELQQAILANKPIEIQNGLWDDEKFVLFWNKIRQEGIYHANRLIQIPKAHPIVRSNGDDWNALKDAVQTIEAQLSPAKEALVLNQGTLDHFFGQYQVDDTSQSLQPAQGYLDHAKDKSLTVNVTSTLGEDPWARLLNECSKRDILLRVHCAPGVELPEIFAFQNKKLPTLSLWDRAEPTQALTIIESTDTDTTVAMLESSNAWRVIDVSECQVSDLLLHIKGELQDKTTTPHFKFTQHEGILLETQKTRQPLILKGHFSQALIDGLALFLLKKSTQQPPQGQVMIICDNADAFSFIANRIDHKVTRDEKIAQIKASSDVTEQLNEFIDQEPLSQLQTRAAFLQLQKDQQTACTEPWQGLRDLPQKGVVVTEEPLDLVSSAQQSQEFTEHRKKAVIQVLNHRPCVFLSGLSGIGKTTFVERELCSEGSNYQLFSGENQVQAWAMDSSAKIKVLFLDEANLSPRQWSEFEGLFNQHPGILIEGKFYPLTEHHKVVFAGNPLSYGDDRQLAPFFERRVSTVLFEPLSKAVIHEKIIKPIIAGSALDDEELGTISQLILEAYALICQGSSTEILISPRELQMMALIAVSNYKNTPSVPLTSHVKQAVYEIGQSLIPLQHQQLLQQFNEQFKSIEPSTKLRSLISSSFALTSSRQPIVRALHERLQLLAWRKANENTLNADQKYGGLGGLILEGEPGIGKSELIINVLTEAGFQEQRLSSTSVSVDKSFYRMPVSMTLSDKKELLLQAFNEGSVVIIDEINSSPMMEQFLNALLMGKNPNTGEPPHNLGFMVIGTQNPATMAGRRIASTALQRRITTMTIPEYHHDEMKQILLIKGIHEQIADDMITSYLERRTYAKARQLSPVPCFRDLLKLANTQIVASQQATKNSLTAAASVKTDNTLDLMNVVTENVITNIGQEIYQMMTNEIARVKQSDPFFKQGNQLKDDAISVLDKLLEIVNYTPDIFKSEFKKLKSTPPYQSIQNTQDQKTDSTKLVLHQIEIKLEPKSWDLSI